MNYGKQDLGPCRCGCGRPATSKKHQLYKACYVRARRLSNVISPRERAVYAATLMYRMRTVELVDSKAIVIGTSPYNWKRNPTPVPERRVQPVLKLLKASLQAHGGGR